MKKINWTWIVIIFFALWAVRELVLTQLIPRVEPISEALSKIILWVGLPAAYIYLSDKKNPIKYFRLDKFPKTAVFWGLGLGIIYVLGALIINGFNPKISASVDDWLNGFILVGLTEEVFFRGFFMRKLEEKMLFWKANIWQAVLFVLIHVPTWISTREFSFSTTLPFVLFFGLAMGYLTKKTDSLWPAIIFHSLADFAVIVLLY